MRKFSLEIIVIRLGRGLADKERESRVWGLPGLEAGQ